jgi:3-isopropylmalate/(R)-2-methylmalate dehydratase small subunit
MNPVITALVAPIDRADVDTDAILPKQFLRSIEKTGYGEFLFDAWRYKDTGALGEHKEDREINPDFVLNKPRYQGAGLLICRRNFGSGSAREHAVWAVKESGFQILIAPSYGDIFANNCFKNNVLPIVLSEEAVDLLFSRTEANPGYSLTVDVAAQKVRAPEGEEWSFTLDAFRKRCLLENLDEIYYALNYAKQIRAFEKKRRIEAPWLFPDLSVDPFRSPSTK